MPGFHLDEEESLALTLYLGSQTRLRGPWPSYPPGINTPVDVSGRSAVAPPPNTATFDSLGCTECHSIQGKGKNRSIDLTMVGYRLNPRWVKQYLVAPFVFDGPKTKMPGFFYRLNAAGTEYVELLPNAAAMIDEITRELVAIGSQQRRQLQQAFEAAKARYPEATPIIGEKIFLSQNCGACHQSASGSRRWQNGPSLGEEGRRVKPDWLRAYLSKPMAVRPFGFYPGSGSRMPDFRLTQAEVKRIARYLLKNEDHAVERPYKPVELSAFAMAKAHTLLREKLPCLGCHQLGDEGGRIGPNLSSISTRLRDSFVRDIIREPHRLVPEGIMPKVLMPERTLELVVNYLLQQERPLGETSYLSLASHPIELGWNKVGGDSLYARYCVPCHGVGGDGNGYNVRYLPTHPTVHADRATMASWPDDVLFDGIFAGGYILNRSQTMPPWGHTLSPAKIRQLIAYIRKLCRCQGPAWSRDNR